MVVLIADSDNVAGVTSRVVSLTSTSSRIVSLSSSRIVPLSSTTRVVSLTSTRVVSLSPSARIEAGSKVSVNNGVLREVVRTGASGAAGESSLIPELVALVAHVGGGTAAWLANLAGHHPTPLVGNILTLRPRGSSG